MAHQQFFFPNHELHANLNLIDTLDSTLTELSLAATWHTPVLDRRLRAGILD
jgi:hypothetical protein